MHQRGLSLLLFVCLCDTLLSFFFPCCHCVWNQHRLGWNVLCTYSRFPEVSVFDRSLELSELFVTLGLPISTFYLCVHPPHSCVHRDSSRSSSGVCTFFFSGPHLRVSRTSRVVGLLEEFCHTDTSCDETKQHASAFFLKIRKLEEELSSNLFIGANSCIKLHYYTEFRLFIAISMLMSFVCRHFGSSNFGTTTCPFAC